MLAARHPLVPGIGIDYRENDRPPELFAEAYALARCNGLRATAHAGEFGMPWTNVATAIDVLGVDRVDHGYTIVDNPDLATRCADRLVFTVVPTNSYYLRTLAPDRWALDHPIRRMAALGLRLHPNTDDPTLHHVTPGGAWELMYSHLGFSIADLHAMMRNGIDACWAEAAEREAWAAGWGAEFDRGADLAGLGSATG
jgi:adenosine deaminase